MHKCIASAQGGTSHRLNPGRATLRDLSRNPTVAPLLAAFSIHLLPKIAGIDIGPRWSGPARQDVVGPQDATTALET